jgi:transcriptional regulator with XRE-family HTH domain
MATALAPRSTGLDLRLRRTTLGVSQTAIASQLGVSRQRVGHLEGMLRPPQRMVARYLAALDSVAD